MGKDQDGFTRFLASSVGAFAAETITLPADVAKTRLQVQKIRPDGTMKYSGMIGCLKTTASEEGFSALWKGLAPALVRQICYSSLCLVLYEPIRNTIVSQEEQNSGHVPFWKRLLAGGSAGAISITIFNPTEILKTQMMTAKSGRSMANVMKEVVRTDGILGLWAGVRPNIARTFLVNAAELGVYDQAKATYIPYTGDNFFAHLGASFTAGVASACTSTPADVVKTRLMNSAGGKQEYRGMIHAGISIFKEEGPLALYKGFNPILVRKVTWVSVFFVSYEQLRKVINTA